MAARPRTAGAAAAARQDMDGLRVLVFCDYVGARMSGGAERVTLEVAKRLAEAGAQITILSGVPAAAGTRARPAAASGVRVQPVRAVELTRLVRAQVAVAPRMMAAARDAVALVRPHVVHAHSLHFHGTVVAARLARRFGLPLVTTVHVASTAALGGASGFAATAYERTVGRFVLGASQEVIAVSRAVADHVRALGADPAHVSVVPNGVDHRRFAEAVSAVPQRDAGSPLRVLFVGRLLPNKGPQVLVEALRLLDAGGVAVQADIVGDGPLLPALRAAACDLPQVSFLGHRSDVEALLAGAEVFVRPSFTEGMPLTVLEAMASGTCVVATAIPANEELVRHGATGLLVPPGDARALADALSRVAQDRSLRDSLGAAGQQAATPYTWERAAELTGAVLLRAAGGPRRAR